MSGPSSRVRFIQYFPRLQAAGFEITHSAFYDDQYVHNLFRGSKQWWRYAPAFFRRLRSLHRAREFDVLWIEKDILPWMPCWIERRLLTHHIPVVMDIDDAVFHQYHGHPLSIVRTLLGRKFEELSGRIDAVFAGSAYLSRKMIEMGFRNVYQVPSVIDLQRYEYVQHYRPSTGRVVIGWIGSPTTVHYLHSVKNVLVKLSAIRNVEIVAIGARDEQLIGLPVRGLPWTEDTEVGLLSKLDIGIMPLPDQPFERGKCAFKIIQYLAASLPVVASPVGANVDVLTPVGGRLARTTEDWLDSLVELIDQPLLRERLGKAGRELVDRKFSLQSQLPVIASAFSRLAARQL